MSDLAERLKIAMRNKDFSQGELARRTSISQPTIGSYISGESEPSISRAVRMADALGVDLRWLAGVRATSKVADDSSRVAVVMALETVADLIRRGEADEALRRLRASGSPQAARHVGTVKRPVAKAPTSRNTKPKAKVKPKPKAKAKAPARRKVKR